jgi:hypothetical protein
MKGSKKGSRRVVSRKGNQEGTPDCLTCEISSFVRQGLEAAPLLSFTRRFRKAKPGSSQITFARSLLISIKAKLPKFLADKIWYNMPIQLSTGSLGSCPC